jgi:hypothetical protein
MQDRSVIPAAAGIALGVGLCDGTPTPEQVEAGLAPNYVFPDGGKGFCFDSSGGVLNPRVVVALNPTQGSSEFDGGCHLPGAGTRTQIFAPPCVHGYGFLIGLLGLDPNGRLPLPPAPNAQGVTGESFDLGGSEFAISMGFAGEGSLRNWAAYDPWPEPIGSFIAARFNFSAGSHAVASFRILEDGRPLTLSLENPADPPSRGSMLSGFGGLGFALRSAREGSRRLAHVFA